MDPIQLKEFIHWLANLLVMVDGHGKDDYQAGCRDALLTVLNKLNGEEITYEDFLEKICKKDN